MDTYQERAESRATARADAWVAYQRAQQAVQQAQNAVIMAHIDDFEGEEISIRHAKITWIARNDPGVLELVEVEFATLHEVERLRSLDPYVVD